MMGFAETQTKLLAGKLDRRHVRTRELGERTVSYIEGWHAIVEANRIFGFEGWDRETVWAECVWEEGRREPKACAYAARVRIRVRAGDVIVCREGSGVGHGRGGTLGEAHESALKEAETDAMKRALMTFGNLFGLALYDKDQRGVRGKVSPDPEGPRLVWTVLSADGHALATCGDPKSFCSRLRQAIGACSDGAFLRRLWTNNAGLVEALRACRPDLTTKKGEHFTNVLERVFEAQLAKLTAGSPLPEIEMPSIDKAALAIGVPRRLRDEEHLERVAALPCLVCGRSPCQAHHLRFAQLRALGRKVSDEWAVPLCNLHHRALHEAGNEEAWWKEQGIDARVEADRLWREHHSPSEAAAVPLPRGSADGPAVPDPALPSDVRVLFSANGSERSA